MGTSSRIKTILMPITQYGGGVARKRNGNNTGGKQNSLRSSMPLRGFATHSLTLPGNKDESGATVLLQW